MNTLGKRIMIIGSPGSGKSTFARQLADITGLPLIHLDKEFWNSGWIETPREEWIPMQESLISGEEWIVDGNYGGTLNMRLDRADTIIWFQLSRTVCLVSYIKRVISTNRKGGRPDMPEGCPEKFDFEFMKYIWSFPRASGKRNSEKIAEYIDKNIIVFNKRSKANMFLIDLKNI